LFEKEVGVLKEISSGITDLLVESHGSARGLKEVLKLPSLKQSLIVKALMFCNSHWILYMATSNSFSAKNFR
jgi:hypothetical protein